MSIATVPDPAIGTYPSYLAEAGAQTPPLTVRREERQLRREILAALTANEFSLSFQTRFGIASPRVTAVEGTVRWQHRRRGSISETALMTLAEKAGATGALQRWAFGAGCETLSRLPAGIRLALNLTTWQVRRTGLFGSIDAALREHDVRPDQLELTLTEAALETLDAEAQLVLAGLFDDGISLAVGQFGALTGSLTLLSRLPLDRVKLDAALVQRLPQDGEAMAMVEAVVKVAHSRGAQVVAAGLENEAQRVALARLGCDEAQGPIFGPPVKAGHLLDLVV